MMENSIDAVYLMNWLGEVKEVNNVACTMLGYSKDEFLEMSIDDIDINYPSRRFNEFWDGKPEGATFLFETIHLHKSGRQIPVEINGIFFKNEGGKYLFGVARDISGRERIENQLKENEALLRQIAENYPDSYLSVIESDYSIGFSAGQEFIKAGLEPAQFIGLSLEEVFGDCSEIVRSEYEKTFNGETRSFELFIHNQYQNYRTVPLIDPNGNIKQILSVVQNITERKITEAIFHENHQRYIKAQVLGNVGNWEYNIQTEEFWASDQGKRIYGFKPESENFTPEEVESCIPERIRIHQALLDLISEEKDYNLEFDIITNDTHEKKTIVSIAELEKDAVGIPLKVTGVIHDITEMKKAFHQKEILMKELSHRVKNNLMMVSSLISFTDSDIGKSIDLSGLKSQIDAVMNTYNSLYQTDDITEINFKEYINNLLENVFAQSAMKVKIKVMSELDRIQSAAAVSIGLIINETAINSLKHGFISNLNPVFSVELNQDSVNRKTIIIVSNNGIPIPESVKLENPGTLGLRLISELVNQMEGSIEMQKAPQPVFRIILPSSSVEAAKK